MLVSRLVLYIKNRSSGEEQSMTKLELRFKSKTEGDSSSEVEGLGARFQ